jgi:hypothetical protein
VCKTSGRVDIGLEKMLPVLEEHGISEKRFESVDTITNLNSFGTQFLDEEMITSLQNNKTTPSQPITTIIITKNSSSYSTKIRRKTKLIGTKRVLLAF